MARISNTIPDLPVEVNIKDEELKKVVRQYNLILRKLIVTLYGDLSDHENRLRKLE